LSASPRHPVASAVRNALPLGGMVACAKCGSRKVRRSRSPVAGLVGLVIGEVRTVCPSCGWRGWRRESHWDLADAAHAGHVTKLAARRARVRRRWIQLAAAVAALTAAGYTVWRILYNE